MLLFCSAGRELALICLDQYKIDKRIRYFLVKRANQFAKFFSKRKNLFISFHVFLLLLTFLMEICLGKFWARAYNRRMGNATKVEEEIF